MNDDKKTSLKDIADNSKTNVKKIVDNIYTKEFSYDDILLKIFIFLLIFWLFGYVIFGYKGVFCDYCSHYECLIESPRMFCGEF